MGLSNQISIDGHSESGDMLGVLWRAKRLSNLLDVGYERKWSAQNEARFVCLFVWQVLQKAELSLAEMEKAMGGSV